MMTLLETLTFFSIMVALAAIPSTSVALVVTRAATSGIGSGMAVAAGIVLGDLVFVLLVIAGLSVVAESLGSLFVIIRYLGAAYLIWLGLSLICTKTRADSASAAPTAIRGRADLATSFIAGFLLTLGDIKAMLFYVSLFPMFVDPAALHLIDVFVIMVVTVVAVGGVKAGYALSATRVLSYASNATMGNRARKLAGGFMVGAGGYLIVKS